MIITLATKKHGFLAVLDMSVPEREQLLAMLREVEAGQFIVLPAAQLDLVKDLIRGLK